MDAHEISSGCLQNPYIVLNIYPLQEYKKTLKALKKLPGFGDYDKDGVQIFNVTFPLIETACKRALELVSKQHDDPKEDPFTNIHILISRLKALK